MKFLRNLVASILGFFIALFLLFMFFVFIGALVGSDDEVRVKPKTVLSLDLSMPVKDYAPKDNSPLATVLELTESNVGLNALLNAIENAKTDANIEGISIQSTFVNAGFAQTQAIRKKLKEFKESGKFVVAYNDFYSQKSYYLSSVADSVFLNPVGAIDFKGLSTEILYYKDFEDAYGVQMEVIRHGKYKSAVEPFLSNEMSEANREQTTSFLKSIWGEVVSDISTSRKISESKLNAIANDALGRNATLANEHQLIDGIIYEDEYKKRLKSRVDGDYESLSIIDYMSTGKGRIATFSPDKVAVIFAQGSIIYGEGNEQMIGQGLINKALKKARENKKVKAVVLRVNSPGGSALASELIWREIELTKKEKPVVVSMGNYAASGGYYIACNASKIIAEPTTITGSIGVFGMLPNMHKLAGKLGINAEQVSTNTSPSYSVFEPMDEKFYKVTQEGVEQIYETFVTRVANGRNMTYKEVDAIAQGRVWSGKEAVAVGLVDRLGGLGDAIQTAAELANIDTYSIRNYPSYDRDLKSKLKLSPFAKASQEEAVKELIGEEGMVLYQTLKEMKALKGIQARMPFVIDIK